MWYYFKCNVSVVWHHKLPSDTHKISPNIDHSMKLMTNSARINGTYQQTVFIRSESNIDWSGYCVGCIIAMSICSSRIAGLLSFVLWMVNISACLSEQLPRMSPLEFDVRGKYWSPASCAHYNVSITEQFTGITLSQISSLHQINSNIIELPRFLLQQQKMPND